MKIDMTSKIQTRTPVVRVMMKGESHTRLPVGEYATVHTEKSFPATGERYAATGNNSPTNQVVKGTGLENAEDQMDQETKTKILQMQNGIGPKRKGGLQKDLKKKRRKGTGKMVNSLRERVTHQRMKKLEKKQRRRFPRMRQRM